jgi:hypothetical protein
MGSQNGIIKSRDANDFLEHALQTKQKSKIPSQCKRRRRKLENKKLICNKGNNKGKAFGK